MTFRGVVYTIGDIQTSAAGYGWREVVLTDGHPDYPQFIPFTFSGEQLDAPAAVSVGTFADVEYSLRGRMGNNGRAFVTLRARSIKPAQLGAPVSATQAAPAPAPAADATPAPFDMTRAYKPGDLCTQNGQIHRLEVVDGKSVWRLVPKPTPAGELEDLPF